MSRSKLAMTTALVLGGVLPAAAQERPFEGTTLSVLFEGHPSSDAIIEMLPEFEEATGITVRPETVPYSDLTSRALLEFSTGSGRYDVVMDDWVKAIGYADAGYIEQLDDYAEGDTQWFDRSDFVPAYIDTMQYEGSQYGLPVYGESSFLMYRTDLFEEYGLEAPETFEQLRDAARTIQEGTEDEINGITLRGEQGIQNVYVWAGFLWGFGGQWFDEEGNSAIGAPEAIEALTFYSDLLNDYGPTGVGNFGWQENRLAFQQGRAAMTIDATVNGAFAEDPEESAVAGKVGYAPVPVSTDDPKGGSSSLSVHGFYMNASSDTKDAAWTFMSWATAAEQQINSMSIEPHSGVTSQSAIDSPEFQERYGAFSQAMTEAISRGNTQYLPNVPAANEIINNTGIAISQALVGSATPEAALSEAAGSNDSTMR